MASIDIELNKQSNIPEPEINPGEKVLDNDLVNISPEAINPPTINGNFARSNVDTTVKNDFISSYIETDDRKANEIITQDFESRYGDFVDTPAETDDISPISPQTELKSPYISEDADETEDTADVIQTEFDLLSAAERSFSLKKEEFVTQAEALADSLVAQAAALAAVEPELPLGAIAVQPANDALPGADLADPAGPPVDDVGTPQDGGEATGLSLEISPDAPSVGAGEEIETAPEATTEKIISEPEDDGLTPEKRRRLSEITGPVRTSLGIFLIELAPTTIGGLFDLWNETIDLGEAIGGLDEGSLSFLDLPDFPQPTTIGGRMLRGGVGFLVPFFGTFRALGLASKAVKATKGGQLLVSGSKKILPKNDLLRTGAGALTRGGVAGFAADTLFTDENSRLAPEISDAKLLAILPDAAEERLEILMGHIPVLGDLIPDYLAERNPDDTVWEKRFKKGLEGIVLGQMATLTFAAVAVLGRSIKAKKLAKKEGIITAKDFERLTRDQRRELEFDVNNNQMFDFGNPGSTEFFETMAEREARLSKIPTGTVNTMTSRLRVQGPKASVEAAEGELQKVAELSMEPKEYINYWMINDPADLQALFDSMKKKIRESVKKEKRGFKEVERNAPQFYRNVFAMLGKRPRPMLAEELHAADNLLRMSMEMMGELAAKNAGRQASDVDAFTLRKVMAIHVALDDMITGSSSEGARSLGYLNALKMNPAMDPKLKGQFQMAFHQLAGGVKNTRDIAKTLVDMFQGPGGMASASGFARSVVQPTFTEAAVNMYTMNLLSNPAIHAGNILSNTGTILNDLGENFVEIGLNKAFGDGQASYLESFAEIYGLGLATKDVFRFLSHGTAEGFGNNVEGGLSLLNKMGVDDEVLGRIAKTKAVRNALAIGKKSARQIETIEKDAEILFRTNLPSEYRRNNITTQALIRPLKAVGLNPENLPFFDKAELFMDAIGRKWQVPGEAMGIADKVFKLLIQRKELYRLATRVAINEAGKVGAKNTLLMARIQELVNNPSIEMKLASAKRAEELTFTGEPGELLKSFAEPVYKYPGLRMFFTFVRTPSNVTKFTFERTPLAYLSTQVRDDFAAGGMRASRASSKLLWTAMWVSTIMFLNKDRGNPTGDGPRNKALLLDLKKGGWNQTVLRAENKEFQLFRSEPATKALATVASAAEIINDLPEGDADYLFTSLVLAYLDQTSNIPFMESMADIIRVLDNGVGDTAQLVIERKLENLQPMSGLGRQINRVLLPGKKLVRTSERDPEVPNLISEEIDVFIQNMINRFKAQTPGAGSELKLDVDSLGYDKTRASGYGWGFDFITPIPVESDGPSPVHKVLKKNGILLDKPMRKIAGISLTIDEQRDLKVTAGQILDTTLRGIIKTDEFKHVLAGGRKGGKARLIREEARRARKLAENIIVARNQSLLQKILKNGTEDILSQFNLNPKEGTVGGRPVAPLSTDPRQAPKSPIEAILGGR